MGIVLVGVNDTMVVSTPAASEVHGRDGQHYVSRVPLRQTLSRVGPAARSRIAARVASPSSTTSNEKLGLCVIRYQRWEPRPPAIVPMFSVLCPGSCRPAAGLAES